MKIFAFAIVLAIVAAVHAQVRLSEQQRAVRALCIMSTTPKESAVTALFNGDFSSPSKNIKCFVKCFGESLNYIKNGVLNKNTIVKELGPTLGEANVKAIVEKCQKIKGSDACDTAFHAYECFFNAKAALVA